jgi:hypothetical protein
MGSKPKNIMDWKQKKKWFHQMISRYGEKKVFECNCKLMILNLKKTWIVLIGLK